MMAGMKTTAIVCSEEYLKHNTGLFHPECPARYSVIFAALKKAGLLVNPIAPRLAGQEDLLLCHTQGYIEVARRDCASAQVLSTGDVAICPDSYRIALLAAGGVLNGVDALFTGQADNVFCLVRPPGHHACSSQGMGFCLFNNVAIGARYAQTKYKIKKALIIDWDVHHGNGTQEIFQNDPSIFYFSTHAYGIYPGTGLPEERGVGNVINCPILPGPDSPQKIFEAFEQKLRPVMQTWEPECVFISCGFDALESDPLGTLSLAPRDFATLTRMVKEWNPTTRLISVLEGGYDLKGIAEAAVFHVKELRT